MIIAILPSTSSVETLLNNLSEADFKLKDVSILMKDPKLARQLARDAGPFKGVAPAALPDKLAGLGLTRSDAQAYADAMNSGQVFVGMSVQKESQQAALAMFNDYHPQLLRVLPG